MKYKILFIDEEQETLDDFLDYIEASTQKGNITALTQLPLGDLNEMVDCIIKINPDAIITDFKLNDSRESIKYNVPYNGTELVQAFQNIREAFPCFVMTAFDDLAISESEDVNIGIYKEYIIQRRKRIQCKSSVSRQSTLSNQSLQIQNKKCRG